LHSMALMRSRIASLGNKTNRVCVCIHPVFVPRPAIPYAMVVVRTLLFCPVSVTALNISIGILGGSNPLTLLFKACVFNVAFFGLPLFVLPHFRPWL
jgi:hypothetical protein